MASDTTTQIRIPFWLWAKVIFELRRRGAGRGESGAFLLGRANGSDARVSNFLCYDELDANAYDRGAIAFHATGYAALWEHCRKKGAEVLLDVHTHPGPDVRQSHIDARHPMLPVVGHTAMIVPNYAATPWWSLATVGIYEYLGEFKWRTHAANKKSRRVKLSLW